MLPVTSGCDIKDEPIKNVEPATIQRMESDHIRIKCEPEENVEDMNSTASTVENIDILRRKRSMKLQKTSSIYVICRICATDRQSVNGFPFLTRVIP